MGEYWFHAYIAHVWNPYPFTARHSFSLLPILIGPGGHGTLNRASYRHFEPVQWFNYPHPIEHITTHQDPCSKRGEERRCHKILDLSDALFWCPDSQGEGGRQGSALSGCFGGVLIKPNKLYLIIFSIASLRKICQKILEKGDNSGLRDLSISERQKIENRSVIYSDKYMEITISKVGLLVENLHVNEKANYGFRAEKVVIAWTYIDNPSLSL